MGGIVFGFFKLQNKLMKGGIRVDEATEIAGVDEEVGVPGYADFVLSSITTSGVSEPQPASASSVSEPVG